jgi:hypothetical protein
MFQVYFIFLLFYFITSTLVRLSDLFCSHLFLLYFIIFNLIFINSTIKSYLVFIHPSPSFYSILYFKYLPYNLDKSKKYHSVYFYIFNLISFQ